MNRKGPHEEGVPGYSGRDSGPRHRHRLITIAAGGAILVLKLTVGLAVLALLVHLLTH
jgi:hypothetical protein